MKHIKQLLTYIIVIYLGVVCYIYLKQRSLLYNPTHQEKGITDYSLDKAEEVFITTKDHVKIQAWYHPPHQNGKMVIFLHGKYGNITDRATKLQILKDMGYGFIIPAWRGFGKSDGSPTEKGLYNDAHAVIDYIKSKGIDLSNTIMIGESLGTGIATKMATQYTFKGLFLITPYTTISDRAQEIYYYLPVKMLLHDNFNNLDNIKNVHVPVFIIHGDSDLVIPHAHTLQIMKNANHNKKSIIYAGIDHTNYDDKQVFKEMDDFFNLSEAK